MALFHFGKKKEEKKASACCCSAQSEASASSSCCCGSAPKKEAATCCGAPTEGICCIKVLGSGCKSCHALYESAKEAVQNLDLKVEVEYITDMEKITAYGVMRMPALVVNEKVVSMGKVLKTTEVEKLLRG